MRHRPRPGQQQVGGLRGPLLDNLPPATFIDWRYLAVAAGGGLIALLFGRHLQRLNTPITVLDAAGSSLFAVTGASKAIVLGFGPAQAVIVGGITAVGGGTLRDVLIRRTPFVLTSELYAIPALIGAIAIVVLSRSGSGVTVAAVVGAALCFVIRMVGVWFGLNAPYPLAPGSCSRRRRVTVAVPVPGRQLGGCRDHQCLCRCPASAG